MKTTFLINLVSKIITDQKLRKIMKIIKKSSCQVTTIAFLSLLLTSCGAANHAGCPGQDRPSFKSAYDPSMPAMYEFYVLQTAKKSNDVL